MDEEGELQRILRAPAHDQGMKAVGAVEFVILDGVNDVESDQPADNSQREDNRCV
jgi:hypothetical protein